jgi:alkylhydroperoxidase/carboxymuconolactone decarboxylase family protein YurZ
MADVDITQDTPVLDTLTAITAVSLEKCDLSPRDLMISRIAALAAVGAPPASYLMNVGPATELGVSPEEVQAILVAVAPIIGTPRTVAAAGNIMRALGLAILMTDGLDDEDA